MVWWLENSAFVLRYERIRVFRVKIPLVTIFPHGWLYHHTISNGYDGYRVLVQKENSFELTRILSYLSLRTLGQKRTKAEFSNHHFCLCKSKDSSELKFRKIFNSNEFSPMRGDGNTRKIFLNFNSEESNISRRW
jgi:hypothetical protein